MRAARTLLFALTVIVAASCAPPPQPPAGWAQLFITRDGADVTPIGDTGGGRMVVKSPASNVGANSRSLFWLNRAAVSADQ